jgi:DegV family protein with EDD domain
MIGVLTDTTASIPAKLRQRLQIETVPYYVHRGLETLRDMVDVKPAEFARWLSQANRLPTTSNPGPGDYLRGLKRLVGQVKEVIAFTMTSKGSGAYQSCLAAVDIFKDQFPDVRVEVVDTLQVAMSQGWVAIEAARAGLMGLSFEQVMERARNVAKHGRMIQTADTLRYLHMGGRIGKAQHLMGSLLNIKPLIGMADGEIVALGTARSRLKAYRRIVDLMQQEVGPETRIKVAFMHVAAWEELQDLKMMVMERFECVETIVTDLSPALAVHSGPGTVGVSFFPARQSLRKDVLPVPPQPDL